MSAFFYTYHRKLHCLNVDDYVVENGKQLKKIASDLCGVSFDTKAGIALSYESITCSWWKFKNNDLHTHVRFYCENEFFHGSNIGWTSDF